MEKNADICLNYGVAVQKKSAAGKLGGQDKIVTALVCFSISGILALIDLVKILMDKYKINPDKLI